MPIVTVVDDDYFTGQEFAKILASELGFRYVDGEILIERAAGWGSDRDQLHRACEEPPRLLDLFLHSRQVHFLQLRVALAKDNQEGNIVCYGAAADLLNLGSSEILRVRVTSSFETRQRLAQNRMHLTTEEAKKHIENGQHRREKCHAYLRESKSMTPYGLRLLINLDQENVDQACDTIREIIERRARLQPANQDAASTSNWVLSTSIRAAIAQCPETRNLDLDVAVEGDAVVLSLNPPASDGGSFPVRLAPSVGQAIRTALAQQPGTRNLHSEITVQGDTVVLRGIVHSGSETVGFEPVPARVETSSKSFQPGLSDNTIDQSTCYRSLHMMPKRRDFLTWQYLALRHAVVAAAAGAALVAALVVGGLFDWKGSQQPNNLQMRNFVGVISDTACSLIKKGAQLSANCIKSCVHTNRAKYAFIEDAHAMIVSNPQVVERFAAREVFVTGASDPASGELRVASIRAATP